MVSASPLEPAELSGGSRHTEGDKRTQIDRDRIASRAYELYISRGAEHGRDMDDWLQAERELSRRS
jgi:hypothetical protein